MLIIPVQFSRDEFVLWVVLEDENIERIRKYDPADIVMDNVPGPWKEMRLIGIVIGYASPVESEKISKTVMSGEADLKALIEPLSRGFEFSPEKGDTTAAYINLGKKPN